MKIHGTAEGASLSKKDFGVAFAKASIPAQTLCQGQTTDSNQGFDELSYKQITGCTAGNTLVSCSVDFYNLDDASLKFGAYSDNGSNVPDQLLAYGEVTNQTISNTYTTLTMTFSTIINPVPADGIVWVAIMSNKQGTSKMRATTVGGTIYTSSAYDAQAGGGDYSNYANNLYTTAPFQAYGGNSYRMCVTA